jgi:streptomycin 6-kinase
VEIPTLDEALRERLVRRFGDGVGSWLDEAPGVLASIGSKWRIQFGDLIPRGTMSVVVRCRTSDVRNAVFKLCPDKQRIAREAAGLQWWTTPHAPTVFAADSSEGALLLEAIEPGTSLAEAPEKRSLDSVAKMLRGLHDHPSPTGGFPPVRDRIVWLFDAWDRELARCPELLDLMPPNLPARGRRLALKLATDNAPTVLLHGDLNPGNVLDGGPRRGLVAIDPAPCIGDAAFDATDLVFAATSHPDAIANVIEVLALQADLSEDRLYYWCVAFAGMDASEIAHAHGPNAASEALLSLALNAPPL